MKVEKEANERNEFHFSIEVGKFQPLRKITVYIRDRVVFERDGSSSRAFANEIDDLSKSHISSFTPHYARARVQKRQRNHSRMVGG